MGEKYSFPEKVTDLSLQRRRGAGQVRVCLVRHTLVLDPVCKTKAQA